MEGFLPLKVKRKDLEDVTDDFSDFSLCSPARKIRRLDAELPPIIEDREIPMRLEESVPREQSFYSNLGVLKIEELPIENEERAIVLFNPLDSPLQQLPSRFSVSVDPHIISGIKNQVRQSNESSPWRISDDKVESEDSNLYSNNDCLAVIPWVPSPLHSMHGAEFGQQTDNSEMMEAEETEEATMDVEDNVVVDQENGYGPGAANHLHQWQQQHCMIPQLPHNPSTPIIWYR
ncbi:hypothetical protein F511_09610 [Dorcoceras hygrometricum]|uniref:Uncharacterized protein n=1 Tax=Dorcoceras hygrometricum TaxID=472368 RepID=A0A2Z7CWD0_9LAMI|nr:hypothetical protein F511_09610 [Dorcoceras hygrometricum]